MDVGICLDLYLINYFGNVDFFYKEEKYNVMIFSIILI